MELTIKLDEATLKVLDNGAHELASSINDLCDALRHYKPEITETEPVKRGRKKKSDAVNCTTETENDAVASDDDAVAPSVVPTAEVSEQTVPVAVTEAVEAASAPQNEITPAEAETPAESPADAQYKEPSLAMQAIARAGAELVQHGKLNEVQAIMRDFGIDNLMGLKSDKYADFITALRGLGASL